MRRPQPPRHSPSRQRAPLHPLGQIAKSLRAPAEGTPNRAERIELWRRSDREQGERPDYLLWRHLLCRECPPEKRRDVVELALGALRARDPQIHWAAVGLVIAAVLHDGGRSVLRDEQKQKVRAALRSSLAEQRETLKHSPLSLALLRWWASIALADAPSSASMMPQFQSLIAEMNPGWRLGRPFSLTAIESELLLPLRSTLVAHTTVKCLKLVLDGWPMDASRPALQPLAEWKLVLCQMQGFSRLSGSPVDEGEPLALLGASQAARLAGDVVQSARLAALALQGAAALPKMSDSVQQRFKVSAWLVAEAGLELPPRFHVRLDDLPFPGDPPSTPAGQETVRLFEDPDDISRAALRAEVEQDSSWREIADAGQSLHHPLAALAWMGKRARSIAMKKSTTFLETAVRLALRHGCLGTAARLLQECPRPDLLLDAAKAMRENLRRMPFLRDAETWSEWASLLGQVWGRLETDAISEAEDLFLLHEILADRPATAVRSLPPDLRMLTLRHPWGRRPSRLTQALTADVGLLRSLEHQRPLEHWSLAADARTRPDLAKTAWISVVTRGDPTAWKYSVLAIGPQGQVARRDRLGSSANESAYLEAIAAVIAESVAQVCPEAEWLLISQDETMRSAHWPSLFRVLGIRAVPSLIPSWEWASRVIIKSASEPTEVAAEVMTTGENASPSDCIISWTSSHPSGCALISNGEVSVSTKWTAFNSGAETGTAQKRSTHIGLHPLVVATAPCHDLVRAFLSQSTLCFIEARSSLAEPDALYFAADSLAKLHRAVQGEPSLSDVTLHGVPWLGLPPPAGAPLPR